MDALGLLAMIGLPLAVFGLIAFIVEASERATSWARERRKVVIFRPPRHDGVARDGMGVILPFDKAATIDGFRRLGLHEEDPEPPAAG